MCPVGTAAKPLATRRCELLRVQGTTVHCTTIKAKPGSYRFFKIEKALAKSTWRRRGIYLTAEPGMDREKYEALFQLFLEGGFLIPPSPAEPLILPLSMSPGEESKLARLLEFC